MTNPSPSLLELERRQQPAASDADCVEAIAERTLAELGSIRLPVRLKMVASVLGAKVEEVGGLEVGCVIPGDGHAQIKLRAEDPQSRQRFTLGHECSHLFMPGFATATQYRCCPRQRPSVKTSDVEALCDHGASRLLLPTARFVPDAHAVAFGWSAVAVLADRYDASFVATAIRFVQVWVEPAALLVFEVRHKPSEHGSPARPRLRLQWTSTNDQAPWPYFFPHKSVDEGDPFDRANQGEIVQEHALVQGICTSPIQAEVHARSMNYQRGTRQQERVVALVRRSHGPVLRG